MCLQRVKEKRMKENEVEEGEIQWTGEKGERKLKGD